jgi:hypothetical protein
VIDPQNTFARFAPLKTALPPLVRKQRKHAKKIAAVAGDVDQEKETRKRIDELLLMCGFKKGEGVTCSGYDVVHRERKGATSYDMVVLATIVVERLVQLGMRREDVGDPGGGDGPTPRPPSPDYVEGAETFVVNALKAVQSVGDTAKFAEVSPMKGATVRT